MNLSTTTEDAGAALLYGGDDQAAMAARDRSALRTIYNRRMIRAGERNGSWSCLAGGGSEVTQATEKTVDENLKSLRRELRNKSRRVNTVQHKREELRLEHVRIIPEIDVLKRKIEESELLQKQKKRKRLIAQLLNAV